MLIKQIYEDDLEREIDDKYSKEISFDLNMNANLSNINIFLLLNPYHLLFLKIFYF